MNTKKAIELIEHVSWNRFGNYGYDNNREEIIALLKRGEKFEEMWEEIIDELLHSKEDYVVKVIYFLGQKRRAYFPEDIGKTVS